jgi:hypothetical protein
MPDIFVRLKEKDRVPRKILMEVPNTKFHENPSSESSHDTWARTDIPKLRAGFRYLCETAQNG